MLALVRYADEQGGAFPGIGTLCRVTRIGRTKAIESLAELEARELFVRQTQTRGKGFGANHYRLPLEPPMAGLEGERRVVRQPNQSAARTSPPRAPASPPAELALVREANGGSPPAEPYLPTDLSIVTAQGTGEALVAPLALQHPVGPKKTARRRPQQTRPEIPLPADWQPTEEHRKLAAKYALVLDIEVLAFRGNAEKNARIAVSWNGAFSTWLARSAGFNLTRAGRAPQQRGGTLTEGDSSWLKDDATGGHEKASVCG